MVVGVHEYQLSIMPIENSVYGCLFLPFHHVIYYVKSQISWEQLGKLSKQLIQITLPE